MASLKEQFAKKRQQKHPKKLELFSLSVKYCEQGSFQLAIETLTQFIELNPDISGAYLNRGLCYKELKKYELALVDYNKVIELNPSDADAYLSRGVCYRDLEKYELALVDYNKVIELNPSDADAYLSRGVCYRDLEKYELALADYKKAIDLNPSDAEAYLNRGFCYNELKKHELALADLNKAIKLNPSYFEAYNNRGVCYRDLEKYELAFADYSTAIKLNSNFTIAYLNRGFCYEKLEDYKNAINDYNKAIELNPRYADAYYHRGYFYSVLNEFQKSINDYNEAIKLDPNYADAYCKRGICYIKLQKYELALADFNKAIELNPYYVEAYYNRGYCYYAQEDYGLALIDCNKVIELDPNNVQAYFYRAICAEQEYYYFSEKYYDEIENLNSDGYFLSCFSYNNLKKENYEIALESYNKAIELSPDFSMAYFRRGALYFEETRDELYFSDFDKAINFSDSTEDKKQLCFLSSNFAVTAKEYNKALAYIEQAFEHADSNEQLHKVIYLKGIEDAEKLDRKNKALKETIEKLEQEKQQKEAAQKIVEEKNQQLLEKEKELEDMMSMFAHKFRSPLDAIIYNTTHENQIKLYTESAQTMRGLLDIFSIISADDKTLTDKIKNDNKGNANLMTVFNKNLNMTLLHLLSVSGMSKIHQHYMNYSKSEGKITDAVSYKEWCDDYFEMEGGLQKQWEQEFSALLNQSASLAERLNWLNQYFFNIDIIGFEQNTIQFKEYETTESFLFILMNEILVNAFKYYASESKQPIILEWTSTEDYQVLSCRNPSIRRERDQHKGSGKGHTFLSALARKTGCKFTKPKPQDDFLLEFAIPNQLLLSNSGTEK